MNFIYKIEKKIGKYAIRNLSLILILCYAAGYLMQFMNSEFLNYLTLNPYAILHGQVWRLVSWILIPPNESNIFFALIMMVFYYSIGTTLERTWGTFQYNLYIFSGMFFTVLGSFLLMGFTYLFRPLLIEVNSAPVVFSTVSRAFSTYYVNMSIFLAFASTFPDNTVLLMFIIPIKVKWLGIVYGLFLVYEMVAGMLYSDVIGYIYPFVIGSSLLNFVLFFFTTRNYIRMNHKQRKMHKTFKKHTKQQQQRAYAGIPTHKCAVCGRTEKDGEDLVFRFCSKCEGNYEYCQDHLYTHVHVARQ